MIFGDPIGQLIRRAVETKREAAPSSRPAEPGPGREIYEPAALETSTFHTLDAPTICIMARHPDGSETVLTLPIERAIAFSAVLNAEIMKAGGLR